MFDHFSFSDLTAKIWRALESGLLEKVGGKVALLTLGVVLLVWIAEGVYSTRTSNYRSRGFLHDLSLWIYYRIGIHNIIFVPMVIGTMEYFRRGYSFDLLKDLPFAVQLVASLLIIDFFAYWIHRAEHHFRFMWIFHTMHHSQENLTFATIARIHPIESLYYSLLIYLPVRTIGIIDPMALLPMYFLLQVHTAMEHTRIPWRLGPLYWVFVTPKFHAYHHSSHPDHYDRNYGHVFSFWDHLFGTAVAADAPNPTHFGLSEPAPATMAGLLLQPFRQLLLELRSKNKDTPVPHA